MRGDSLVIVDDEVPGAVNHLTYNFGTKQATVGEETTNLQMRQ